MCGDERFCVGNTIFDRQALFGRVQLSYFDHAFGKIDSRYPRACVM